MSYDTISLRKEGNGIRYSIASSCPAGGLAEGEGELTNLDTVFDHIDGVFIDEILGDSVYFDVDLGIIKSRDLGGEFLPMEVPWEDLEFYQLSPILERLKELFKIKKHPTLGEIWEAVNKED